MSLLHGKEERIPAQDCAPLGDSAGARLGNVLISRFFRLLWANLICIVFCLPVLTIPSALCGLNAVLQQFFRTGRGDVLPTFWEEFKSGLFLKTGFTLLALALPALLLLIGSLFGEVLRVALCAAGLAFCLVILTWFYAQLPLLRLSFPQALRNALLLTAIETKRALLILLVWAVTLTLLLFLWPLSFLILLIIPVLPALLLTAVTLPVLEERLITETT